MSGLFSGHASGMHLNEIRILKRVLPEPLGLVLKCEIRTRPRD